MAKVKAGRGDQLKQVNIRVSLIRCDDESFDAADEKVIKSLMESIPLIGLLHPITVQQLPGLRGSYNLTAGRKRWMAYKNLGLTAIPARVEKQQSTEAKEWADLARIDENLVRGRLSTAQSDGLMVDRKRLYEAAHPETVRPKGGRPPKGKKTFAQDTAERTGMKPQTIRETVGRAQQFTDAERKKIVGTSLDSDRELTALARMKSKAKRDALIECAAAGEQVSAVKSKVTPAKPKSAKGSAQAEVDTKAFQYSADDARNAGADALDAIKSRKYDPKIIGGFAKAAGKVLEIWNKVASEVAKQQGSP